MPKVISPATWNHYLELLRTGSSRKDACREAGVSIGAARAFLQGNSATARRWRQIRHGQPCPLCGCMAMHRDE